uniref:Uncharacterized protein n=1 Tax=Rhizophora mucronata TaxID=61149 RepID=A0A2P2P5M3_RHIMU
MYQITFYCLKVNKPLIKRIWSYLTYRIKGWL